MKDQIGTIHKTVEKMDGWLLPEEGQFLYEAARRCTGRGTVVEIGSWKGKSTIYLANGLKDGAGGVVYAIDPHVGAPEHHEMFKRKDIWTFDEFKRNIRAAKMEEYVAPMVGYSHEVVKNWNKPIELLWIDGAHAYEAAKQDFDLWFPHLLEGGILAYHDSTYDDVRRVVRENMFFSPCFREMEIVGTISFGTKIYSARQSVKDKLRNRYVYLLNLLHDFRGIPLPSGMRAAVKTFFKKALRVAQ